ncbi:MAG: DEAD/DEAH box helicase family protein [Dehalobacter sp.]|nr:DEAD/DEAH box helicase family protein [Dehalobacter sp.]
MSVFHLKPFQENAISDLRAQFLNLWKTGNRRLPLIFKSPTGSGKTVMIAELLKTLSNDPQFNVDNAYLWFSFSEDSYLQSKKKLADYYGGANELDLLDLNDFSREKLENNNIFFINWQKIKTSTKEGRKLRTPSEYTSGDYGVFDEFIKKTQSDNRELVLIIDEAHRDSDTELAEDLVNLIDPRIILKITATPKTIPSASDVNHKRAGFVEVDREDVVEAGLIKEKIVTQTREDLERLAKKEYDQDKILLELAYNKRLELQKAYANLSKNINPLVIIQLPNDDQARAETLGKFKIDIVREFLKEKKVPDNNLAIWLSEEKENLEEIERNSSPISFLIFKQAAATGWDCPRASILVMFREIKTPIFHTQTVGRILRMPEAIHYQKPELNIGYLYTNYERNQIQLPETGKNNKPFIYESKIESKVEPIFLESTFMGRIDYNDLGDTFQSAFNEVANSYFGISEKDTVDTKKQKVVAKGLLINDIRVVNKLIVDAEIEDYDNFIEEIKEHGSDLTEQSSRHDIERLYNLLCFNLIAHQEEENKKFAPERSWGKLKTALNLWLSKIIEQRSTYYTITVADLLRPDSILTKVISKSLETYRPIRQKEVKSKESKVNRKVTLEIPRPTLYYTDDYEIIKDLKKCAVDPFYLLKEYAGKANEIDFIKYLESKDISWWYKNGNSGSEYFSIPYHDESDGKDKLFYPDWIVKAKDKIIILDTKSGFTVTDPTTKYKAEALQIWIKQQNEKKDIYSGGIITKVSNIWKINSNENYSTDTSTWKDLGEYL